MGGAGAASRGCCRRRYAGHRHAYYLADLSDAAIQRHALSVEAGRVVPGFAAASYGDWAAVLDTWRMRAPADAWLVLDEMPYLVQVSPALPSIIQRIIDTPGERPLRLLACGSSQRMMHGLVLDETAPLYGRAAETVQVAPMPPEALPHALQLDAEESVVAYSIWGGLPRNWELARGLRLDVRGAGGARARPQRGAPQ